MKKELSEVDISSSKIEVVKLDSGISVDVFMPENPRSRIPFENEHCNFTPVGYGRIDGLWFPLGYKVVTSKMESLGLRNNPSILTFPVGVWVAEKEEYLVPSNADWGGIWTALRRGSIKTLKDHCWNTWGMETKGFLTAIDNPVFSNSYRIKSQRVMLLQEIKS